MQVSLNFEKMNILRDKFTENSITENTMIFNIKKVRRFLSAPLKVVSL